MFLLLHTSIPTHKVYKKTTPIDFRIECIFDKNESTLTPKLVKKPDFIKNSKLSSNQVQLIILE